MRKSVALVIAALVLVASVPAMAELQNVVVGGQLKIRGNWYDLDNGLNTIASVEQRTRLSVKADFTDSVTAFIELDSYDVWGEDFRSNYISGVDGRGASVDDVEVYQAFIEANQMWGTDLRARVGRQELKLGSGWLVGTNDTNSLFYGLSFDAVRLTYATEQFSVDALMAKLAERSPVEEDGDTDLYGVYASYLGIENVTLDAYWLFVRDAANFRGSLDLHTFGLRGAGTVGALDFEAEVAYQMGDLDDQDSCPVIGYYDDDDEYDWDSWAANAQVGYTFDTTWTPRIFVGGAYFDGNDGDPSFDRLYSGWEYSQFLDVFGNLTNVWTARVGASAMPTETVKVTLAGAYLDRVDTRDRCWHDDDESALGWELDANVLYNYTEDLSVQVGYAHFFTEDGLGRLDDDLNYGYVETKLSF